MKKLVCLLAVLLSSCLLAINPSLVNIQRTLKKAGTATADQPATLRVMFYGQSVTYGNWTKQVSQMLRERFPHVRFQFVNAAMGSFESNWLIHTAEHDLYYYHPDLVILHTYGPTSLFEKIVQRVRQRTTSDLIIWTSHRSYNRQKDGTYLVNPMTKRLSELRRIAKKYDACLVDVRQYWEDYCKKSGTNGKELVADFIHPNQKGCDMFTSIFSQELVYHPELTASDASGSVNTISLDSPAVKVGKDHSVTVEFTGNYLTCDTLPGAKPVKVRVLLDGKPAETCPELFHITRPVGIITERPALLTVTKKQLLSEEDWTIRFLPGSEPKGKRVHYRLEGSRSGFQGEGWSDQDFTSKNGAVGFGKKVWITPFMFRYWPKQLAKVYPEKCTITFRSFATYPKTIPAHKQLQMVKYARFFGERNDQFMPTVLIQGVQPGKHRVTLIPVENTALPIRQFTVHCPNPKWN